MRIRRRLALFGAAVTAAAMIVFGVLIGALGAATAPNDQERELKDIAMGMLEEFRGTDPAGLAGRPLPPVLVDPATSTDVFIAVYAANGSPIYSTGWVDGSVPDLPAAVVVEALDVGRSTATIRPSKDVELLVHGIAWKGDGADAVLVAGQSTAFVEEQLAGLSAVIWVSGFIALLAATAVGWLVSGRALRPLRELAATTDKIARTGDLSERLPQVKAEDEVGTLTQSFNGMLDSVESAQERLEDALAAQRRFVADASHELRSPLTTIRSNAGFLRDRPDVASDDRVEAIGDIAAEADRMSLLVDDLLVLASRDAGRRSARIPVDVGEVVEELERRAGQLAAAVRFDVQRRVMVTGDPSALARLAWILIHNASVHGAGEIDVVVRIDEHSAVLTVADDGPGFAPDEIDRVFERFYRADHARSPAGSGLGLAIAESITRDHGGAITAANRPTGGAELRVTLPLA